MWDYVLFSAGLVCLLAQKVRAFERSCSEETSPVLFKLGFLAPTPSPGAVVDVCRSVLQSIIW